jgi:hypothetical protein
MCGCTTKSASKVNTVAGTELAAPRSLRALAETVLNPVATPNQKATALVQAWDIVLDLRGEPITLLNGVTVSRLDDGTGYKIKGRAFGGGPLDLSFFTAQQAIAYIEQAGGRL